MNEKDIKLLAGRVIAFPPAFARITGSVAAGLMLAQLNFWASRCEDPNGWIYKTRDEMEAETTLSRSEQETAQRRLQQLKILAVKLKGIPARLHYWIDYERLAVLLDSLKTGESVRSNPSSLEISDQDRGNPANKIAENLRSNTKITPEITPENTLFVSSDEKTSLNHHRSAGTPNSDPEYPPAFEEAWKLYPKRAGGNPKNKAYAAWRRFCARETPNVLNVLAGVRRYAAFCQAVDKTGTEFVMQAARFFGRERCWADPWDLPAVPYAHRNGRNRDEEIEVIPPPMLPK